MRKKVVYEFTDEDIALLEMGVPEKPCIKCGMGGACCGCQEHKEWMKIYYDPLSNAGLIDISNDIDLIKENISEIVSTVHDLKHNISKVNKKYPGLLQRFKFYTSLCDVEAELGAVKESIDSGVKEEREIKGSSVEEFEKKLRSIRDNNSSTFK